ncbi:MAG: substrate-binding domain-containing protein, partial [Bacteroidota bacterium]|nr:substrate-binding domain-containing protein [Bacteroidota bacterium]
MKTRPELSCITSFFLIIILLSGCGKNRSGEPQPDTATSGSFELTADETLRPVIDSLVYGFNVQTPNAKVTVRYKNATEALDDLIQQRTRLVLIGRPLAPKERDLLAKEKIELIDADVAENAIGCIVSSKSKLESISMDSLRTLITNQSLPAGNANVMVRISSPYLSSTESVLDSIFGLDHYQSGLIRRYETSDSIISRVRADEHAIGFVNASWLKQL